MASLAQRVSDGFSRVASEIKNSIRPRLLPPGGGGGMMLIRASDAANSFGWAIPPQGAPKPHFCNIYMNGGVSPGGAIITDPDAPFLRFAFNTVLKDPEGLWDMTNQWYTIPEDGVYMITSYIRPPDGGASNFGYGIDVEQKDNENFLWTSRPAGPTQYAHQYSRLAYLTKSVPGNAKTFLRAYTYNMGFKPDKAAIQIAMISKGL